MAYMTLREICEEFHVSRRAVQGYEQAGLIQSFKKNRNGHLLYDVPAQEKIKLILFFQEMGFTIREIAVLLELPNTELKYRLEKQIDTLVRKRVQIKTLICKAKTYIESL